MANPKDKPNISPFREEIIRMVVKGEKLGYDGGKPRTPVGSNGDKKWEPPRKETTPSNRKR